MKKHIKAFCRRGMMFAWGGPVILAVVWMCLNRAGVVAELTVGEAALGILSTTVLAFVAAGISVVYQIENLPVAFAGLLQAAVLYVDYLGLYLLNNWLPTDRILFFTAIFAACFAIIWLVIYLSTRIKINKMNKILKTEA